MINPWDRQAKETARAFEGARLYFDQGPDRSLARVAEVLGKSLSLVKRWSGAHAWPARAAAFDLHMREVEQQALEEETRRRGEEKAAEWAERLEALRETEWRTSQAMLERVATMLKFPLEQQEVLGGQDGKSVTIIKPVKWTGSDAAKLGLAASKLARLATGAETDRVGSIDPTKLSDDELERAAATGRI